MKTAEEFLTEKIIQKKVRYIPYVSYQALAEIMDEWVQLNEDVVKAISSNPDVIKSVCAMCEQEKELKSENLCKECFDSLP